MITIRAEQPADEAAIHEVNALAFGREAEARLVAALRGGDAFVPELSLVAVDDGQVVGHVLLSRVGIEGQAGDGSALALGPIAVRPERQRQGIGSALVRQALDEARRLGYTVVVLIGHPDYYPRFGFGPARARGLESAWPVPDEVFMVRELVPGALAGVCGAVRYAPAFDAVAGQDG